MSELVVVPDADSLASVAAQRFTRLACTAIAERTHFVVVLAGSSTPRPAYALLAHQPLVSRVDWTCTHVFWGDERCVPPDHPDSNYRMASRALLERVPIPPENVHRVLAELPPEDAAAAYRTELARGLREDGRLDLVLLGRGDGWSHSLPLPEVGGAGGASEGCDRHIRGETGCLAGHTDLAADQRCPLRDIPGQLSRKGAGAWPRSRRGGAARRAGAARGWAADLVGGPGGNG